MVLGSSSRRRRLLGRMPRAAARELEYEQPRPRLRPSAGVFVLLVLHSVRTQRRVSTFGPSRMRGLLLKLCSLLVCALRVDRLPLAEHDMLPVDSCSTHTATVCLPRPRRNSCGGQRERRYLPHPSQRNGVFGHDRVAVDDLCARWRAVCTWCHLAAVRRRRANFVD